jgi:DNA-nicking Smr family endonuclease
VETQKLKPNIVDDLVISLLIDNDFQIGRVDDILYNLIGLATFIPSAPQKDLSSSDKQNIYQTSRAPLKAMFGELKSLEDRLVSIRNSDSKEFTSLSIRVKKLLENIKQTQLDVSTDVFERINSRGVGKSGEITIDLHALHVEEAKAMLQEYVFPALPVVKRIVIITGRGLHSRGGKGVLKDEIKVCIVSFNSG